MNKTIVNLLKRNGIIKKEEDFQIVELANTNPLKKNVLRIFSKIKNKNYIVKKCKKKEIKNLYLANRLLFCHKIKNIDVLKPIDNLKDFFLFEDMGLPLNKKFSPNSKVFFKDIVNINDFFLQNGYLWGGLALRNIFYSNRKYILIDFGKFYKISKSNISRRHLLFVKLNLIQSFNKNFVDEYIYFLKKRYHFSNKIRKMDRVEKLGWAIFPFGSKDKFLDYFDDLTINAEMPLKDGNTVPFEIGHIIDELVSAEISFLWSLLMYRKRKESIKSFKKLLDVVNGIIEVKDKRKLRFHLTCLIISLGNFKNYKEIIEKIEKAKKCSSVALYDDILINTVKSICKLTSVSFKDLSIIARGSYGEYVLARKSDLDFEIVNFNKSRIKPVIPVEDLVCKILSYLKIKAQGTMGRPVEKDVIVDGESRDLFEIFELRLIFGNRVAFLDYLRKFKELIYKNELWKSRTEYERKERTLNSKYVFEEMRFLITRLAIINGKQITCSKVSEKIKLCPEYIKKQFRVIMKEIISIRNNEINKLDKLLALLDVINKIKIKYELPLNGFIINEK